MRRDYFSGAGSHVFFLGGGARAVLFRQTEKISGQQHFKTLDNFSVKKFFWTITLQLLS